MVSNLIYRYAVRETLGLIVMGVALFWSAGRIDWWPGWAALAVMLGWTLATAIVISRFHPGLLAERLGPRRGAKPWDTTIMSVLGLAQLMRYILAGLDQRYGWSGGFSAWVQIVALILCALGYVVFIWATASNPFFSQIMRIQTERGHTVVTGGPYRYVRHPGYAGAILFELAVPILLASWVALIPSLLGAILLIFRTDLEDRTLQAELAGYQEYSNQVVYRLMPGVW
jgi:protein-S-isoprenylcysteine O-methyltransferase Ste14